MKKLAICLFVLALAAAFVPTSQAAPRCISFTNFCDQIQYDTAVVGNVEGTVFFGDWNWECTPPGFATSIIGNGGTKLKVGTRPVDTYFGSGPSAYSFGFTFKKSSLLFDLYGTNGLDGGFTAGFQINQPWTQATGSCGFAKTHGAGLPKLTSR